jgi:hypothetical protein
MQFERLMTFPIKLPETKQYLERTLQLFGGAGIPVPVGLRRRLAGAQTRRRISDADRISRRHLHL